MKTQIFYFIYGWLVWPLLRAVFTVLGRFDKKIDLGLQLRKAVNGRDPWLNLLPPTWPTLWIHCASGEFEYAKPVITCLKKQRPDIKIVVTFFSPTYADMIRKFKDVDWAVPLPWDTPRDLTAFLESYGPFAMLVARTDVWPQMARQARLRNISSALFSATLSRDSGRAKGLGRWASSSTFDQLDVIFTVTEEDAQQFRALGVRRAKVEIQGDTRYDQVQARLASPKVILDEIFLNQAPGRKDFLVCGSTWPEDEAVLIPALALLRHAITGVLVPHEPTLPHLRDLEEKLRAAGLIPVLYSAPDAANQIAQPGTTLIVDKLGILAELYAKSRFAFVGGSFRKTVHSVMEPLAAGCITFVGPLHANNREAGEFTKLRINESRLSFVTPFQNTEQLVSALHEAQTLPDVSHQIRSAVQVRAGSSQKLANWIITELETVK